MAVWAETPLKPASPHSRSVLELRTKQYEQAEVLKAREGIQEVLAYK